MYVVLRAVVMAMRTKRICRRVSVCTRKGSADVGAADLKRMHALALVTLDLQDASRNVHEDAKDLGEEDEKQTFVAVIEGTPWTTRFFHCCSGRGDMDSD